MLPRAARWLLTVALLLVPTFVVVFGMTWRRVPVEGAKLHGNIDVGVDLLGDRHDLLWVAFAATVIATGNLGLASWLRVKQPVAAMFLLASTVLLLGGLAGGLLFISSLNRGP